MEKMTARKLQAQNTKQQILQAAQSLLEKKIMDNLSIQEICAEANVSVGAFYHHFDSKAGIIIELYKEVDSHFEQNVAPLMLEREPIESIKDYLASQCKYGEDMGLDIMRNVYKAQMTEGNEFFISEDRGLPEGLKKLIARAQSMGALNRDLGADDIASDLLIISRGIIYHWCLSGGRDDMEEKVRSISDKYLKGCI